MLVKLVSHIFIQPYIILDNREITLNAIEMNKVSISNTFKSIISSYIMIMCLDVWTHVFINNTAQKIILTRKYLNVMNINFYFEINLKSDYRSKTKFTDKRFSMSFWWYGIDLFWLHKNKLGKYFFILSFTQHIMNLNLNFEFIMTITQVHKKLKITQYVFVKRKNMFLGYDALYDIRNSIR